MSESLPEHPVAESGPRLSRSRTFPFRRDWRSLRRLARRLWRDLAATPGWLGVPLLLLLEFSIMLRPQAFDRSMVWLAPLLLALMLLWVRARSDNAGAWLLLAWWLDTLFQGASWLWALTCLFRPALCLLPG